MTDDHLLMPGISLLELTSTTCRYPIGEVGEPDFHFCGAYVDDRVYCEQHAAVAFTKHTFTKKAVTPIGLRFEKGRAA